MQRRFSQFKMRVTAELYAAVAKRKPEKFSKCLDGEKFVLYFRSVNHRELFDSHAEQEASSSLSMRNILCTMN